MPETLVIENVDPDLLEKQRMALLKAIYNYKSDHILWGLLEMLDAWSDKRFKD